jgi:hypothetical protein
MKSRFLLALTVLLMAALSLPVHAAESEGSMLPGPEDTHAIAGTGYQAGPAVRDGTIVDVVFGGIVCGWR